MPLTAKGREILAAMRKTYGSEKKAKEVFYASINKGKIKGVHVENFSVRENRNEIELVNNFHNTATRVRPTSDGILTPRQVAKAKRALCGISGCKCGVDDVSSRGGRHVVRSDNAEGTRYRVFDRYNEETGSASYAISDALDEILSQTSSIDEVVDALVEKNWIAQAIEKPGALRKSLGAKEGHDISRKKLKAAAEKGGKMGKRARLALTLRKFN